MRDEDWKEIILLRENTHALKVTRLLDFVVSRLSVEFRTQENNVPKQIISL
jgi:hypothetical protein